ncbi:DNA-processing protein DprA [Helicovermis profundi]|uniref:DNA-processing protein DprA n=1 Tax=Helicovermis profundi TaxID=3065157 RepID=A0AAU9EII6_9FIRM|nr:DNA-processing protein DprA [Clostridia bacterium S502]
MESKYIDLLLFLVKGIGPCKSKKLIMQYGYDFLANCTFDEFMTITNNKKIAREYINLRSVNLLKNKYKDLLKGGSKILTYSSKKYPKKLKEIDDPPMLLFYRGNEELLNSDKIQNKTVAIVGTRNPSYEGEKTAYNISKLLSENGYTIISGFAYGIDTFAHKAAIDGLGDTIAVLGCGLDICYPSENKKIYKIIREENLFISEYPDETKPYSYNFPKRNRIISALSESVIVIEAGIKSGTIITVNHALNQGKDVYAVPGSIYSMRSKGTNFLIKEGAIPIVSIDDMIEYFDIKINQRSNIDLTDLQERIFCYIKSNPKIHISNLPIDLNISSGIITKEILELQLIGKIDKLSGNRYISK